VRRPRWGQIWYISCVLCLGIVGYIVYSSREDPTEIIVTECMFIERVLGSLSTNAVRCLQIEYARHRH
jgi:hypothetical protein